MGGKNLYVSMNICGGGCVICSGEVVNEIYTGSEKKITRRQLW